MSVSLHGWLSIWPMLLDSLAQPLGRFSKYFFLRLNFFSTTQDLANIPPTLDKHSHQPLVCKCSFQLNVWRELTRALVLWLVLWRGSAEQPPGRGNVHCCRVFQFGRFLFVIPMSRITSSAFLAPAKAAAWIGKWPSLFCLQSFAPCFSYGRKEMSGEKDKQRQSFVSNKVEMSW